VYPWGFVASRFGTESACDSGLEVGHGLAGHGYGRRLGDGFRRRVEHIKEKERPQRPVSLFMLVTSVSSEFSL
jgi:hypothetical protein